MRRQIAWVEKLEDGSKRQIRVTFRGRNGIKWQFKHSAAPIWDYDTPPSQADWAVLLQKVENRYRRGRGATFNDLELVRQRAGG